MRGEVGGRFRVRFAKITGGIAFVVFCMFGGIGRRRVVFERFWRR